MWNIEMVCTEYGNGPLFPNTVETGYMQIIAHEGDVVDCSFSPDGTAIATASTDGKVKFFQVSFLIVI